MSIFVQDLNMNDKIYNNDWLWSVCVKLAGVIVVVSGSSRFLNVCQCLQMFFKVCSCFWRFLNICDICVTDRVSVWIKSSLWSGTLHMLILILMKLSVWETHTQTHNEPVWPLTPPPTLCHLPCLLAAGDETNTPTNRESCPAAETAQWIHWFDQIYIKRLIKQMIK